MIGSRSWRSLRPRGHRGGKCSVVGNDYVAGGDSTEGDVGDSVESGTRDGDRFPSHESSRCGADGANFGRCGSTAVSAGENRDDERNNGGDDAERGCTDANAAKAAICTSVSNILMPSTDIPLEDAVVDLGVGECVGLGRKWA